MTNSEKTLHVIIADSQYLVTESLKLILQSDGKFFVFKIVIEKKDLVESLTSGNVQLLIIDPLSIDLSGFSEIREIISNFSDLKVLVLTNSVTKTELQELNNIGITNIILKTADKEEIFEALDAAIKGKKYYSDELYEIIFEVTKKKSRGEESGQLTSSEMEIVKLISDGLTTKEIASRKYISFHTVITHRKNIFRKLNVSSVSELIMYAVKSGWINIIEYHI
jgi:DNA-binding NarL/FixJ family response regulator